MRWPFSRHRPAPTVAGTTHRSEPAAWRSLPTIHRAVERIEPSAHTEEFTHDLGSRRPLEHFLQPLGHDVRTEAPGGIASGIAGPAVARMEGPEIDYSHPADRGASVARAAATGRMPDLAPVRVLRAEEGSAAEAPAAETEPEIVPDVAAVPEAGRAPETQAPPGPEETEGPEAPANAGGAEIAREPASVSESEIPAAAVSEEAASGEGAPEPQAPLVGRRLGLGDPFIQRPSTATDAPSGPEESLPLAGRAAPSEAASTAGTGPSPGGIHRAVDDAKPAPEAGPASAAGPAPAVQRAEGPGEPGGIAPVAGATPSLVRGHRLMRQESSEEPESPPTPAPATDLPAPRRLAALPAQPGRAETSSGESGETATVHRTAETYAPEEPLPTPAGAGPRRPSEADRAEAPPQDSDVNVAGPQEGEILPEPAPLAAAEGAAPGAETPAPMDFAETEAESGASVDAPPPAVAPLVSARPIARLQRFEATPGEAEEPGMESLAGEGVARFAVPRVAAGSAGPASSGPMQAARSLGIAGELHRPAMPSAAEGRSSMLAGSTQAAPLHYVSRAPAGEGLAGGPEGEPEGMMMARAVAASATPATQATSPMPLATRKPAEPAPTTVFTSQGAPPAAHPGEAAMAAGLATPDGNGSVVFRTPADYEAPVVQRQEEASNPLAEAVRGFDPGAGQGEAGGIGAMVGGLAKKIEFDQLVTNLEEPLYRRLSRRLRFERERRGQSADLS